jgi:hypothetical protein
VCQSSLSPEANLGSLLLQGSPTFELPMNVTLVARETIGGGTSK